MKNFFVKIKVKRAHKKLLAGRDTNALNKKGKIVHSSLRQPLDVSVAMQNVGKPKSFSDLDGENAKSFEVQLRHSVAEAVSNRLRSTKESGFIGSNRHRLLAGIRSSRIQG